MTKNFDVDPELDCFGFFYSEHMPVCSSICKLRSKCRAKCQSNLKRMGESEFEGRQKEIINANKLEFVKPVKKSRKVARRKYISTSRLSELVQEIAAFCTSIGLTTVSKKEYLGFKYRGRSVLRITRTKSEEVRGLVRFVFANDLDDFPQRIVDRISVETTAGGKPIFNSADSDINDLKETISNYVKEF